MEKIVQLEFEGETVPAVELEFETEKEPWNVYDLGDGAKLRVKQAMISICKLKDKRKPNGEPIYIFKMTTVTNVEFPSE